MRKLYPYLIVLISLLCVNYGFTQADNCNSATNLSGAQLNGSCNNFTYSATPGDPFFLGGCGHNVGTAYTWWRFTAVNTYLNVQFDPGFQVAIVQYGGPVCMDNGGAMTIITNCNNLVETTNLVVGTEYYIMVHNPGNPGSTCMRVYNPPTPPANDNCASATSIPTATLNSDVCPGGGLPFNFGTPTQDVVNFNCNAPQTNLNVWFSFTAQGTYVEIVEVPGVEFFIINWNGLTCTYDAGVTTVIGNCGVGQPLESYDLIIGEQYYVMATTTVPNLPVGSVNLCIFNPEPPPNDDCADVINLLPADLDCMSGGTSYEFGFPTHDVGTVEECGHDGFTPNIWFSFTARGSYAEIEGQDGFQFFILDFTGDVCDAAGAFLIPTIECNDGTNVEFHDLEEGREYYIMVASLDADPDAMVNLCVYNPEFPENDEPCDAIILDDGDCHTGSTVSSYPEVGGGIPGLNCGTTNNLDDVWYTITLGDRDYGIDITLSNIVGFDNDIIIAIYAEPAPDCREMLLTDHINSPADCYSGNGMEILHLYPNTTYFIRVTSTSSNDHGTFTLCINHIPIPEPCSYSDDCLDIEIVDPVIIIPYDPFEDCNGGSGPPLGLSGCFEGCNIGSTPDDPAIFSNCIQPGWRTTWYRFNTQSYPYTDIKLTKADVEGIGAMGIDLFDGCSGTSVPFIQCLFSPEGETEVNFTLLELELNTDYYLAIGSPAAQVGHFDVCINIYDVPAGPDDNCAAGAPKITPDKLPPYSPGDIVNFEVFIPAYDQTNTIQWLQAVIPIFGEGWDPLSFTYFNGPPTNQTLPNNNWDWYDSGEISYNYSTQSYQLYVDDLGRLAICHFSDCPEGIGGCLVADDKLPAGWYSYQDGGGPLCVPGSGDPNLGWGDGTGPWTFSFSLQAREFDGPEGCSTTGYTDLGVSIYIMSDQQTGCWNPPLGADACRADVPGNFEAQNKCCRAPEVDYDPPSICSEGNFSYNIVTDQDNGGDVTLNWTLSFPSQLQLLSGGTNGNGRTLNNSFLNESGSTLTATYTIIAVNSAGCDGESIITVEIHSELEVILPDPPVLCPGESVTLTPNISGGTATYVSYLWSPGGHTGPTYTVSPATTTSYSVVVIDDKGCDGRAEVTVRVAQDFNARIEEGPTEFCISDEFPDKYIRAAVPTTGAGAFNYNWAGPSFDLSAPPRTISPLVSGNYIVTITDIHGCENTANIDILVHDLPVIDVYSDDVYCENEEAFDFDYVSYGVDGSTAPVILIQEGDFINPVLFVVDPPFISEYYGLGTFLITIQATDPVTGCINTEDYELTIQGVPDVLFDMDPICFGTPVIDLAGAIFPLDGVFTSDDLTSEELFSYGAVNSAGLEPGDYEFYYEVDDGVCIAIDTFSFEITPGPELFLSPDVNLHTLDCNVESVEINIQNPGNSDDYNWFHVESGTNVQNKLITITVPGTYIATYEDDAGCLARDTVLVLDDTVGPDLAVDEPLINIICGDSFDGEILVTIDGEENVDPSDFDFAWTVIDGPGSIDGDDNTGNYDGAGTYRLTVLNTQNGCSEFLEVEVAVDTLAPDLSMDNPLSISCTTNLPIQLTADSDITTLDFVWTAEDGGVVEPGEENNQVISVNEPGLYSVQILNTENNCTNEGSVEISDIRTEPTIEALNDLIFNCFDNGTDTIFLSSDAIDPIFSWVATDPDMIEEIIDNNTIVINNGGSITFTVIDEENGCEETIIIDIDDSLEEPDYTQDADFTLDCQSGPLAQLNITTDPEIEISWSTVGGSITSDTDIPTIDISGAGTYTFDLFNPLNGCSVSDEIIVSENTDIPELEVSNDVVIDCIVTVPVTLSSITDPGLNLDYTWTTVGGDIPVGQEDDEEITVDQAGTYTIRVVNADNECFNERTITVEDIRETPEAELDFEPVLNCYNELGFEIGIIADISNSSIEWTLGGNSVPGSDDQTNISIDQGGTYTVTLTNLDNNCEFEADIDITDDRDEPSVNAGGDQEILCSDDGEKQLTGSSNEPNVSYLWTATSGSIATDPTLPTITVEASGTYVLTVTNLDNGCTATDQAIVVPSTDIPQVDAGSDLQIDCESTLPLVINAATQIGGLDYTWTATGGGSIPVGQENNQEITIDAAGTYTVTVINPDNDCQNTDQVIISDIRETPTADTDFEAVLNCNNLNNSEIVITTDVTNPNFQWFFGGTPVGSGNGLNTWDVEGGGTYEVILTNLDNNCEETFEIIISEDLSPPNVDAGGDQEITCTDEGSIQLNGNSTNPDVSYVWSTSNGSISTNPNQATVTIAAAGTYTLTVTNNANGCTSTEEIVVVASEDIPVVNAGADLEYICSTVDLNLSATSDVGGGEEYTWSFGGNPIGNGSTITVDQPGTYTVEVFNPANGCSSSDQVIITDNTDEPDANAGPDVIMECSDEGQKVIIGASTTPGVTYEWSGGNILPPFNQAQVTVLSPGTYTLTVTNPDNDCVATDVVIVEESTDIPAIVAPDQLTINCFDQETGVVINASSPVAGIEYLWTSSESFEGDPTGNSIKVFEPGTYNIQVLNPDNNCVNNKNIVLVGDFDEPEVDAGLDAEIDCINNTTALSGSSPNNVTYSWSTTDGNIVSGANSASPTINAVGTYILTVIDQDNGCVNQDQAIVTSDDENPNVSNLPDQILGCEEFGILEAVATSTTPGVEYTWTTSGGASIISGENSNTIVFDGVGTYTVEVHNPENGCSSFASFDAEFTTDLPEAKAGEDQEITCEEKSVSLQGSATSTGSVTYTWTETQFGNLISNPNTPTISVDLTGTYELTVRNNENGCTDTDQVIVFAEDDVLSNIELDERDVRCYGEGNGRVSIVSFVGGVPPYSVTFNGIPGGSQTSYGALLPGEYLIEVVDANGCELERFIEIEEPDSLAVEIGDDLVITKGDQARTDPIFFGDTILLNYEWDTSRVVFSTESGSNIIYPTQTVRLTLTVTDENGCTASDSRLIIVEKDPHIWVPNVLAPNGGNRNNILSIYAGEEVKSIKSFSIFDRWGNFVYENKNFLPNDFNVGWDGTLNGKPVQTGVFVYFLVAEMQDGSETLVKGDVTVVY